MRDGKVIKTRYNQEIQIVTHYIDDLIMIYQKNIKKLKAR